MDDAWQFPGYAALLVLAVMLTGGIAMAAWPRRSAPGGTAFVLMMIATAVWSLFRILEAIAVQPGDKIYWARFEFLGVVAIPTLWLLFTRQYSRRERVSPGLGPIWLWIVPAAVLALVFSNAQHGWFWTEIKPVSAEPGANLVFAHGPAFWVSASYNYLLVLIGTVTLLLALLRGKDVDRRQATGLLAGAFVIWIANMIHLAGLFPIAGLDPTPFAFVLTGATYIYTMYRYRLFDPVPVSRHTLLDNMIEGVLVLDNERRIADLNTAALGYLGLSGHSSNGAYAKELLANWPQLLHYCNSDAEAQGEVYVLDRHFDVRAMPLYENGHRRVGLLLVLHDISTYRMAQNQLREANERLRAHVLEIEALQVKLREQAIRDSLTGLFNRRFLEETLQREFARAARSARPLGIVMIDIDHFKELNDAHGHRAGDAALLAVGRLLAAQTRGGDVACRYGGEEFVLALPGANLETAHERAEHLRRAVESLRVLQDDAVLSMTISAGIAAYPVHGERVDQVLDNADRALYQAKNSGRNQCVVRAVGTPPASKADVG
ncbi:MAG: diguanylate cyclase [Burkholderiales bacterium]|nr:diguanylate cyclase [Burkholderiales bacterium]